MSRGSVLADDPPATLQPSVIRTFCFVPGARHAGFTDSTLRKSEGPRDGLAAPSATAHAPQSHRFEAWSGTRRTAVAGTVRPHHSGPRNRRRRAARVLFHRAVPSKRANLTTRALPAAPCSLSARPSPAPRRSPLPRLARSRRAAVPPSSSTRPTLVAWGVRGLPPRAKRCRTRLRRVSAPAPPSRGTTPARRRTAPPPMLRRPPAAGPRRTPSTGSCRRRPTP